MQFTLITLFPEMYEGVFNHSIIKRSVRKKLVDINIINLRDFAADKYRTVDGHPYGGGQGMILRVDIIDKCLNQVLKDNKFSRPKTRIILTDPRGTIYSQKEARRYTQYHHIVVIAGHYEGIDERVMDLVDERMSLGKFILTGGEIPAMVIVDSVVRLLPGVLRNSQTTEDETFSDPESLEYPQYTEPREFQGKAVPDVLVSGHHAKITEWKENHKTKSK